ncbi:MAG: DUF2914 domain-containing protein [Deltaproteobacteria bacterium]|jgi:hypothetical protein
MGYRFIFILSVIAAVHIFLFFPLSFLRNVRFANADQLKLSEAVMCEEIVSNAPKNPTVVFSISREKAVCFTLFDPVPQKTVIYHNWYHRDVPSAKIRLELKPPRWSTYSSIQLRETDIGPWRVEITDENENIFGVLRFSVTD